MRLQESPPIQPRRNHRDRAWSMLPVLQALMYCLGREGDTCSGAEGYDIASEGQQGNGPQMRPSQGGGAGAAEAKVTESPAGRVPVSLFAHCGFLLGRIPANPGTQWDAHLLTLSSEHPGDLGVGSLEKGWWWWHQVQGPDTAAALSPGRAAIR